MKAYFERYYAIIPTLLICVLYTIKSFDFPAHDFANYFFGGKFLAEGNFNSSIYFPFEFNKAIADAGYRHIFASYAPNTPFLALLFMPLSSLPLVVAKFIFNLFSISLFLYSIQRLVSFYKINTACLFLIPILFFVPIKNEILFGQVYFLLFFLLAESWLAYEKKQLTKMAIFVSLAIFIKVFPVLIIFVFLYRRQFRPIAYIIFTSVILFTISVIISGSDIWIFYLENVLLKASNGEISEAYVSNYQSVFMFLKQLLVFDSTQNPGAVINSPAMFSGFMLAFKITILTAGFYITRKANNSLFVISYWILAMILLSPYGSTYTFVLLIIPYFSLVNCPLSNAKKVMGFVLLFIISNVPLQLYQSNVFPLSYFRLFALLLVFALFLSWIFYTVDLQKITIAAVAGFVVMIFSDKKTEKSSYLLDCDAPILIYDYNIKNNLLTYFYWNEMGRNSKSIVFQSTEISSAVLRGNQVFFANKQLTFDSSNKFKPLLINGKTLLYLSDSGRGIGFYTIRKMPIR